MTRTALVATAILLVATPAAGRISAAQSSETIREVRVHGNHTTPDADILALAGLTLGAAASGDAITQAEERLRASGRFTSVEIRKRFRSITDPSDILVIVLVDERAGVSESDLTPGALKRFRLAGMWLPVLDYADGYGFTYGARVSFIDVLGRRSRVSVPLTWGGERQAALEVDRSFERGPFSRVEGALALTRRENPHFEIADTRRSARVRAERSFTSWLRAGAAVSVTNVAFGDLDESHTTTGADVVIDTRRDPAYPRNAVHVTAGLEHLAFPADRGVNRRIADVRGYLGLIRSTVLALRVTTSQVDAPVPLYEQRLLGGTSLLRGYRFGYRAGDNLAAVSAEIRAPITSPMNIGRFGFKGFVDYGTVYRHGERLSGQAFDRGIGGGVFLTATVVRMGLDVAWPKSEPRKPRWHFGLGVTF
jgi:outer membrane protein assembly factor BamA